MRPVSQLICFARLQLAISGIICILLLLSSIRKLLTASDHNEWTQIWKWDRIESIFVQAGYNFRSIKNIFFYRFSFTHFYIFSCCNVVSRSLKTELRFSCENRLYFMWFVCVGVSAFWNVNRTRLSRYRNHFHFESKAEKKIFSASRKDKTYLDDCGYKEARYIKTQSI